MIVSEHGGVAQNRRAVEHLSDEEQGDQWRGFPPLTKALCMCVCMCVCAREMAGADKGAES